MIQGKNSCHQQRAFAKSHERGKATAAVAPAEGFLRRAIAWNTSRVPWSEEREIIRWRQNWNSTPGVHGEQMAHVTTYDDICFPGGSQRQVFVILWVATLLHDF